MVLFFFDPHVHQHKLFPKRNKDDNFTTKSLQRFPCSINSINVPCKCVNCYNYTKHLGKTLEGFECQRYFIDSAI